MRSVMSSHFSQVPRADIPRSSFNRSHGHKTTFDAGYLVPIFVDEALPGDTFNCRMAAFARLATPEFPFMDNVFMDFHFFAVPIRLIWDNWQKFNGEQIDPGDSTDFLIPQIEAPVEGFATGSLQDYMGIPIDIASISVSALWTRAYNLIWNEWYRDENLQDSVVVDRDNGPDSYSDYAILNRNKRFDYFTSCLPWPQKSDSVVIPFADTAPVLGIGKFDTTWTTGPSTVYESDQTTSSYAAYANPAAGGAANTVLIERLGSTNYPNIRTDLGDAPGTINELRQAVQLQRLYERDARGGTRYTEVIRAHFGVVSPDARMQRPEYLGGGTMYVNVHPIAQTSETGTTPQGNLAAFGTGTANGIGFVKSFTEHCVLIGLASARADLNYQQGLNRMWSRRTRFDFYWPALSHLGEQAVLNKEIYMQGTSADDLVFGYQERYAEYRYKPSIITGKFRSQATGSLDVWHLAQDFASLPALNSTFILENPPLDRVIAVPSEPHFLLDTFFNLKCARPMPVYSVPGLMDHF